MSKQSFRALRDRVMGIPVKRNPVKHPVLSGAVKVVQYVPPRWSYSRAGS